MKTIRSLATLAAAAMMAVAFAPARANAQGVVQGTFKLPFQARWGSANLAPGTYHFEVVGSEGTGEAVREVIVWNATKEKSRVFFLGEIDGSSPPPDADALLCVSQQPTCVVRALQLGVAGETLSFPKPGLPTMAAKKRDRKMPTMQAKAHESVRRVPITFSGK
jgi:hypothetical protein